MMHTSNMLYDNLASTLLEINKQIDALTETAEKQIAAMPYPEIVTVHKILDRNGRPILETMLAAKAQTLSAMASLKIAEIQQKAKK